MVRTHRIAAAFILAAGCLGASQPNESPRLGYSPSLTAENSDLVLVQRLPRNKNDHEYAQTAKVLDDMRGKIKPGAVIRIHGNFTPFSGSAQNNLPNLPENALALYPITVAEDGRYDFFDNQFPYPIGISSETIIPPADVDKVKAALKELQAAVAAPENLGPSRDRALKLLDDGNDYLWSFGVWRLAHETNTKDLQTLKNLFHNPQTTPTRALWLDRVLTSQITGDETVARPSDAELHSLLRSFLEGYVKRAPLSAATTAPATAPAHGGDQPNGVHRTFNKNMDGW